MDLFGAEMTFEDLQDGIETVCNELTKEHDLPPRGIWYDKSLSQAKGQVGLLISYPIFINEPAYPATEDEMKDENRTHVPVLNVKRITTAKDRDSVSLVVPKLFLAEAAAPNGSAVTEQDEIVSEVKVKMDSPDLMPFIRKVVEWKLKHYISAVSSFGCCDLHVKCSDEKRCLHENRLYATGCAYRRNLEVGRIFYGKNKNV